MTPSNFAARAARARKILAIDFGGLGDHLHSLPALWLLRRSCPNAELHVLVGSASVPLMQHLTPWIDRALGYDKRGWRGDLAMLKQLRAAHYDAVIVITASNHAVAFAGLSAAPLRLARRADSNKRWFWQPWLLTKSVAYPFHTEPMYRQRWQVLRLAGFDDGSAAPLRLQPDFPLAIAPELRRAQGIAPADDKTYLHLSASATDDLRDLPPTQMIALWNALHAAFPAHKIAVSGNPGERGQRKLQALLAGLTFTPWKVFAGTLNVPQFISVVQGAALHAGPDSGGLHVARIAGTPSVSWFRPNHHIRNWLPDEPGHIAFIAPESRPDGLYGLDTAKLVGAAQTLVSGTAHISN
ncbi:MAG: hypothetical protein M0P19_09470 [Nevskia sp.]|jgi:heptosyltransferase-3|nr:hypothetical protein [Nevskia sp.]MCK9384404.1 hypothetical protein [Nevskia sp.]